MYVCMYVCLHVCLCKYVLVYVSGLKIGGIVSPNANHFWINYESLWQSHGKVIRQILLVQRITFGRSRITFQMDFLKTFFVLPLFETKSSLFKTNFMYRVQKCE